MDEEHMCSAFEEVMVYMQETGQTIHSTGYQCLHCSKIYSPEHMQQLLDNCVTGLEELENNGTNMNDIVTVDDTIGVTNSATSFDKNTSQVTTQEPSQQVIAGSMGQLSFTQHNEAVMLPSNSHVEVETQPSVPSAASYITNVEEFVSQANPERHHSQQETTHTMGEHMLGLTNPSGSVPIQDLNQNSPSTSKRKQTEQYSLSHLRKIRRLSPSPLDDYPFDKDSLNLSSDDLEDKPLTLQVQLHESHLVEGFPMQSLELSKPRNELPKENFELENEMEENEEEHIIAKQSLSYSSTDSGEKEVLEQEDNSGDSTTVLKQFIDKLEKATEGRVMDGTSQVVVLEDLEGSENNIADVERVDDAPYTQTITATSPDSPSPDSVQRVSASIPASSSSSSTIFLHNSGGNSSTLALKHGYNSLTALENELRMYRSPQQRVNCSSGSYKSPQQSSSAEQSPQLLAANVPYEQGQETESTTTQSTRISVNVTKPYLYQKPSVKLRQNQQAIEKVLRSITCITCCRSYSCSDDVVERWLPRECSNCRWRFENPAHMQCHLDHCHPKELSSCLLCHAPVGTRQSPPINAHMQEHHPENKLFHCYLCELEFASSACMRSHMLRHFTQQGDHECPHCHMKFEHEKRLNIHKVKCHSKLLGYPTNLEMRDPRDEGITYVCGVCGKQYEYEGTLRLHLHQHQESLRLAKAAEAQLSSIGVLTNQ